MAAWIATQFNGTATSLQRASLFYLAVVLLVISLATNVAAQVIVRRIRKKMGLHG
jgi:ABC-type phosphate transport system permease subunit